MKIVICGGGPAGLFLALLVKGQNPAHDVRVYEQNRAGDTYGWGVVFSGRALEFIAEQTPSLFNTIDEDLERWNDLTIVHQGESVRIDGSAFSGISRHLLLKKLQTACQHVGVRLHFSTRVASIEEFSNEFANYDLLVGADGVNSIVRDANHPPFKTTTTSCSNRYIWYGVRHVFPTLSLIFKHDSNGAFVAHTYRYSHDMSTFLVECDETTFHRAGLARMTDAESRAYCESVFEHELNGQPLMSRHAKWRQFPVINNADWYRDRTVLLGDALRTVHFSIGSGTRTAMQDALVLAGCLEASGSDIDGALAEFVRIRQPEEQKLTRVASESIRWYEDFRAKMSLSPYDFAMDYLLRGGRLNIEAIRQQAPDFIKRWEQKTRQ